jgi:hypothetical protein
MDIYNKGAEKILTEHLAVLQTDGSAENRAQEDLRGGGDDCFI